MNTSQFKKPIVLSAEQIANTPLEKFPDPSTGGDVSWKTLISSPQTPTDTFTVGIATCAPGTSSGCRGHLKMHRHAQAEIYHVTSGHGVVTIDGWDYKVKQGSVVWIPGDAEHGVENVGSDELVWLYAFAVDGFGEVGYRFGETRSGAKQKAKL